MPYLNMAGMSPTNPEVQKSVEATHQKFSQLLYSEEGIQFYRQALMGFRQSVADWLEVNDSDRLAFVSNATTASRLLLSRLPWSPGDVILTTTHENHTILKEISFLHQRDIVVHQLDAGSPEEFLSTLRQHLSSHKVKAVIISHVSQVDGRIFPVEQVSQLTRAHKSWLLIDGAQAVGHISFRLSSIDFDGYFFPGHKWCGGPMGTGVLILGRHFLGHIESPSNQRHKRGDPIWTEFELGTLNIGLLAGLAKACTLQQQEGEKAKTLEKIKEEIRQGISKIACLRLLEWEGPHAPGIVSMTTHDPSLIHPLLQSARSGTPPISWKSFPLPSSPQHPGIRLSWGPDTAKADIHLVLNFLKHHFE